MLVSHILKSKADDTVVMALPSLTIGQAARMLAERRIGTIILSRDGTALDGIVSERDIVRQLGQTGAACLDAPVSSIMTAALVTCTCDMRADAVLEQMTEGRFRHMPVMEDGALVGLISLGDVVKARLTELGMEKDALEGMIRGH
jgi:CBS domain-containing protein